MKNYSTILKSAGLAGLIATLSSCTPMQQQGAQVGALAGAALGAISGNDSSGVIRGAAVGAAVGAGAAAVKENSNNRQGHYNTGGDVYRQSGPVAPTHSAQNYPLATHTGTPGYVKSPYRPYNTVDVRGIPSGKMAKEPGTNNIFVLP